MNLLSELDKFFADYKANVIGVRHGWRDNFERFPAPGDGRLETYTVHVLCQQVDLFGLDGDYLDDVHPRMLTLRKRLVDYLATCGLKLTGPSANTAISIRPYADLRGYRSNTPLPRSTRNSRGAHLISTEELAQASTYYAGLLRKYGPLVGVVTNNGTVVGPDGGLLTAAVAVSAASSKRLRVVELGSGAGSTALALARREKLASYLGNDFSPEMVEYLRSTVARSLAELGVPFDVWAGSCFDAPLAEADLLSIGVYYQAQPALLARRGNEFASCLGDCGVLIVQSGMLEDPLITELLTSAPIEHAAWPWFDKKMQLRTYFRHVGHYILEQETVLVATNSADKFVELSQIFDRSMQFRGLGLT